MDMKPLHLLVRVGAAAALLTLGACASPEKTPATAAVAVSHNAVDNAVSAGDAGIIITPNGDAVNSALTKARKFGLYTIALDTAPTR